MQSKEIREKFLSFFESKNHKRMRSSSLIPESDPTLFFTNAGMVQFKNNFTGLEKPASPRATTSQKCMRVSGKHNDLENVGRTHRHHTFFEMLGNFSFGDYFKSDAIEFAWEFLTQEMKLDPARLWVSVFREDDEAADLWEKKIKVKPERIIRLDEKDNFWSMGEEGPCGPCTEIHYDFEGVVERSHEEFVKASDSGKIVEIWNLVFMQFNRSANGEMTPLPKPSVDTGMGLERLSAVVQGVYSNYSSDLFMPLIREIEKRVGHSYGKEEKIDVSIRVLADHIRACSFLIGDGVQPSNEGRGYVLRRILRRAIRHGRLLGMRQPFFFELSDTVVSEMKGAYPELEKHHAFIKSVIQAEETRFLETLEKGLEMIQQEIQNQKKLKSSCIPGEVVFKLYDTFGFPVDLVQNIAEEENFTVDMEGFELAMSGQRESGRRAWKGSGQERVSLVYQELVQQGVKTEFVGYQSLAVESEVLALIRFGELTKEVHEGEEIVLITAQTPFYGESGGQVGDKGTLKNDHFKMEVQDTQKPMEGLMAHLGTVRKGTLKLGEKIQLKVDLAHRSPTKANHTATHLLHAALRQVLGEHVRQAGSLVGPDKLRFDFSHFEPVSEEAIEQIEHLVNDKIRENITVQKKEMSYDEAMQTGAMALFGEKYGDRVRVLKMDDFSTELCGGTHVDHSGEIGFFKIIQESSVAAGVRRIEAVTGNVALAYCRKLERNFKNLALQLKTGVEEIPQKIQRLIDQGKKFEKEISQLRAKLSSGSSGNDLQAQVQEKKGIKLLAYHAESETPKSLRDFSDQVITKLGKGIALVACVHEGRVTLILRVSKDLTSQYKAGDLIRPLAATLGGTGGGKPDLAQAGGPEVEKLDQVFGQFYAAF
ncbi:MAG: alanine--tRNA ligase [Deltaproteobacteria bacterium]|nr:alanine--tRNA ligase [Deltaproteobacteria bacterium]